MNVEVSRTKDSFLVFGDRDCLVDGETSATGLLREMVEKYVKLYFYCFFDILAHNIIEKRNFVGTHSDSISFLYLHMVE